MIDQTGNLIDNGNFETGSIAPWRVNDGPKVSTSTNHAIDGSFSAFIDTTTGVHTPNPIEPWVVGLWQYPGFTSQSEFLPDGTYTVSAWFYAVVGQAHIGLAYQAGSSQHYSTPTSSKNQWQYRELTADLTNAGGPVLYGLSNEEKFYVDGVWVNAGRTNLSPYSPANGFLIPTAIPEPSVLILIVCFVAMAACNIRAGR